MVRIHIGRLRIPVLRLWGWIPDPDNGGEDRSFDTLPAATSTVSSGAIDNAPYFKDVSAQLWLPACVGNSVADLWEAATITDLVESGVPLQQAKDQVPDLSRMFPW